MRLFRGRPKGDASRDRPVKWATLPQVLLTPLPETITSKPSTQTDIERLGRLVAAEHEHEVPEGQMEFWEALQRQAGVLEVAATEIVPKLLESTDPPEQIYEAIASQFNHSLAKLAIHRLWTERLTQMTDERLLDEATRVGGEPENVIYHGARVKALSDEYSRRATTAEGKARLAQAPPPIPQGRDFASLVLEHATGAYLRDPERVYLRLDIVTSSAQELLDQLG